MPGKSSFFPLYAAENDDDKRFEFGTFSLVFLDTMRISIYENQYIKYFKKCL